MFASLKGVDEFDDGVFELHVINLASEMFSEHRTFLRYEVFCDDEKISFCVEHIWGWLDTDVPQHELVKQMIDAFRENTRTWHSSDYFLGMREYEGSNFLTLNSSGLLLTKWSGEDIREVLRRYILNLGSAFIFFNPDLTAFRNNWEEE